MDPTVSIVESSWTLKNSWQTTAGEEQFWVATDIYVNRSHVVNRRLIGNEVMCELPVKNLEHFNDIKRLLSKMKSESEVQELIITEEKSVMHRSEEPLSNVALIKKVLPKQKSTHPIFELILKEPSERRVSFFTLSEESNAVPNFSYAFVYNNKTMSLLTERGVEDDDSSVQWIVNKAVPKLIKWMENVDSSKARGTQSLSLVSVSEYSALYSKLKDTYGKQLVQMWPENTDPLKFVYEDIGIATYLLLLWADKPKQRFVDLGCGNGLLVHILNSEGHLGVGYDIRARKIWALYPPTTKLEVRTIDPSDSVFPEADWLVGNHSDELTLWLPVMAGRSSYSCNMFLLPCCPYELDGRKFCRTNTGISQYEDFLNYVQTVTELCGFSFHRDKLRIPSTRRTCFVSKCRTYSENAWEENVARVQDFVNSKCTVRSESGEITCSFKPREEERVRNCTKICSDIREKIVNLVAEQLLAKKRLSTQGWNCGAIIELASLAKIIPQETLKQLKNECGGLQTLLKNHHNIFKVESGKVEFRMPVQKLESDSAVWKRKPCWFHHNHPDKCPLPEPHCSFVHSAEH